MGIPIPTPLIFVSLWSTSYIAIKFCTPFIEPATFVVLRNEATAVILFFMVLCRGMEWPNQTQDIIRSVVVGILINGVYAGGAFASIYLGIDIKLCALILCLQPVVTILLSHVFLGEKITTNKTVGMLAGLVGVLILILDGKSGNTLSAFGEPAKNPPIAILICFLALFAISGATIVQKRYGTGTHVLSGMCIQYAAAAIFMIPFSVLFESMVIEWSASLVLGYGWLILVVSIGATALLITLIKKEEAGSVANLFYLVTPLAAIQAWVLFGESISMVSVLGMLLCILGVCVANNTFGPNSAAVAARTTQKVIFGAVFHKVRVQIDFVK